MIDDNLLFNQDVAKLQQKFKRGLREYNFIHCDRSSYEKTTSFIPALEEVSVPQHALILRLF